jgi:hypothetical protein
LHVALREVEFIERLAELSGDLIEPRDRDDPPIVVKPVWRM